MATYTQLKNYIDEMNLELSIRAERDFAKLNENSPEKDVDRFVRVHRINFHYTVRVPEKYPFISRKLPVYCTLYFPHMIYNRDIGG